MGIEKSFSKYIEKYYRTMIIDDYLDTISTDPDSVTKKDIIADRLGFRIEVSKIHGYENNVFFEILCNPDYNSYPLLKTTALRYCASFREDGFFLQKTEWQQSEDYVPLNQCLVPIISDKQYEDFAERIIKKYYGEVPTHGIINATKFAQLIGLQVLELWVKNWRNVILGGICFEPYELEVKTKVGERFYQIIEIPKNSIIINRNITFMKENIGLINNTIVHECVHYILHWRVYQFWKMQDSESGAIQICSDSSSEKKSVVALMERQANVLAPKILMHKDSFTKYSWKRFNSYRNTRENNKPYLVRKRINSNLLDVDLVDMYLIQDLASDYGVSEQSVRIRLLETEFKYARGTKIYLDGKYLRPYTFHPDSLKSDETFAISKSDYEYLLAVNTRLQYLINTGICVFVENHVVLNRKDVVSVDGKIILLTDEARNHLDLYALKFKVKRIRSNSYSDSVPNVIGVMLRLPRLSVQMVFDSLVCPELVKEEAENKKTWKEFAAKLPRDAIDAINIIRIEQGYKVITKLSHDSGIEYYRLRDVLNKYTKLNLELFTRLCVVLKVPYFVSKRILDENRQISIDENDKADCCYVEILEHFYGRSMADVNKYLQNNGLMPFTKTTCNGIVVYDK